MTAALQRLAIFSARHHWRVLTAWIIAAVGLNILHLVLPPGPASGPAAPGTSSAIAQELAVGAFGPELTGSSPLVIFDQSADFSSPRDYEQLVSLQSTLLDLGTVQSVRLPTTMFADDGRYAIVSVTPSPIVSSNKELAEEILATAQEFFGSGVDVAFGGGLGEALSVPDTEFSDIAGLIAAVAIMFIFFRRWLAVAVPLANALLAVGTALMLIGVISRLMYVPSVANSLATMLGLGVGIDYALFMTTRYRALLRDGVPREEAIGRAVSASGSAIVFAGSTLVAALCSLSLTGIHLLATLGFSAAIAVALSVFASLTLVPALFAIFGDRVKGKNEHPLTEKELDESFWGRFASNVTHHPWRYVLVATIILGTLAAPATKLTLGVSNPGQLPRDLTMSEAYTLTEEGFGAGYNGPFIVVAEMYQPASAPESGTGASSDVSPSSGASVAPAGDPRTQDPRLVSLRAELEKVPGVATVGPAVVGPAGGIAAIEVVPATGPSDPATAQLVQTLQTFDFSDLQGMAVYVGGFTPTTVDLYAQISDKTPLFIGIVIALAFILLMIAYRSLVIPLKAAIMNLISITAAYGVVTAVFVWGWGAELIGLSGPVPIDAYVPMMMFAVLFGLSMDYEVFLLTSFREHFSKTGDMHVSVRRGLAETGRLVTSAALIMVVVFGSFIFASEPLLKIFGVGLSVAVIVDATVVRLLLVPAVMVLIKKGTWWLPRWLDRALPVIELEADPGAVVERAPREASLMRLAPLRVFIVVAAGIVSALLLTQMPGQSATASASITISVLLTVIVLLVQSRMRALAQITALVSGMLVTVIVVASAAQVAIPLVSGSIDLVLAAVAVGVLVGIVVVSRALWLPMVLGSLAGGIGWLFAGGAQAAASQVVTAVILPVVLTAVLASTALRLTASREAVKVP